MNEFNTEAYLDDAHKTLMTLSWMFVDTRVEPISEVVSDADLLEKIRNQLEQFATRNPHDNNPLTP